jgi:hypothetical protein
VTEHPLTERLEQLAKREKTLTDEAEFYKAGKSKKDGKVQQTPVNITSGLESVKAERAAINNSLKAHEREIQQINARFDEDKKRWLALKAKGGTSN